MHIYIFTFTIYIYIYVNIYNIQEEEEEVSRGNTWNGVPAGDGGGEGGREGEREGGKEQGREGRDPVKKTKTSVFAGKSAYRGRLARIISLLTYADVC